MSDWMAEAMHDENSKAWVNAVLEDMAPKLAQSVLSIAIVPGKEDEYHEGDVKLWVELGATIYMEKPLVLVAFGNQRIPPKLARIADEVVRLPEGIDPEGSQQLVDALRRVAEREEGKR